jgi:hypothetical protein
MHVADPRLICGLGAYAAIATAANAGISVSLIGKAFQRKFTSA